jgi:LacI family transcriptional regulator
VRYVGGVRARTFSGSHCREGLIVEQVLHHLEVSRKTLESRMKRAIGRTPHAVICRAQVERAKHLLQDPQIQLNQIARVCGFERRARFFEVFKRVTGITPGEYRRQRR